ncbi:hypothetical protein [Streptomyces cyanogenus]|uniref:Uncharacterized protein n=1 Tax=Streptomyces cyanogenus TaxID=80860 RepID=A0ABX7U0B7_STRCY|nr:hypothetical protein [Streptomyces cyanogenus]QTE02471.1 hypothetical protein S1361_34390 [Streptomyces cyanogenus]
MTDTVDFLALSELLTGEPTLDPAPADAYRQRLTTAFATETFPG